MGTPCLHHRRGHTDACRRICEGLWQWHPKGPAGRRGWARTACSMITRREHLGLINTAAHSQGQQVGGDGHTLPAALRKAESTTALQVQGRYACDVVFSASQQQASAPASRVWHSRPGTAGTAQQGTAQQAPAPTQCKCREPAPAHLKWKTRAPGAACLLTCFSSLPPARHTQGRGRQGSRPHSCWQEADAAQHQDLPALLPFFGSCAHAGLQAGWLARPVHTHLPAPPPEALHSSAPAAAAAPALLLRT